MIDLPQAWATMGAYQKILACIVDLEDWELEACRARIPDVIECAELCDAGVSTPEEEKRLAELMRRISAPIPTKDGGECAFQMKHMAWLIEAMSQKRFFETKEEFEQAKQETAAYYGDGKPFNTVRWMQMRLDREASEQLGGMGRLS